MKIVFLLVKDDGMLNVHSPLLFYFLSIFSQVWTGEEMGEPRYWLVGETGEEGDMHLCSCQPCRPTMPGLPSSYCSRRRAATWPRAWPVACRALTWHACAPHLPPCLAASPCRARAARVTRATNPDFDRAPPSLIAIASEPIQKPLASKPVLHLPLILSSKLIWFIYKQQGGIDLLLFIRPTSAPSFAAVDETPCSSFAPVIRPNLLS